MGRKRSVRGLLAPCVLAAVLVPVLGRASAAACVVAHGRPYLTGFAGGSDTGSQFYAATEGAGSAEVTVGVTPGHCVSQPGSTATYQTEDGVATASDGDYPATSDTTGVLCADVDGPAQEAMFCPPGYQSQRVVDVVIHSNDPGAEGAVEPFLFRLTSGQPAGLAEPSSAPIHIVDGDGAPRASLEPTANGAGAIAYSRSESFSRILIPVFGAGTSPPASIGFTVTPDPAAPATPGEDFHVVSPNPLPGDRLSYIEIAIVNDTLGEGPESVVITLTGAVDGPPSTTLTILDNEENVFPRSRFHHPRHKWRYKKSDYRIREFHVFATDEGGSGVVGAQLALRRNLRNRDCVWLTGAGWQKKDCSNRVWLPTTYDDAGDLFYHRMKQLKSSVDTRIKNYTAFSRAIDGAGNVEKEFAPRRNANTFEIKRARRR